jgi:hypothetical protein
MKILNTIPAFTLVEMLVLLKRGQTVNFDFGVS